MVFMHALHIMLSDVGICPEVHRANGEQNVHKAVILYLLLYIFHKFNSFKYLNTWNCTTQTGVLVLVLFCV